MTQTAPFYPDWKAPADDGSIYIWPEPAKLCEELLRSASRLAAENSVRIQNVPLAEVRLRQRRIFGHSKPIIATGHQAELYHPGVWVKDVLASVVAKRIGCRAWRFIVDTDQPKNLSLRAPGISLPITDDPKLTSAAWTEFLHGPSPEHLAKIRHTVAEIGSQWGFEPALTGRLSDLESESIQPLVGLLNRMTFRLNNSLGVEYLTGDVSSTTKAEPYLLLVHHLLTRGEKFAHQYNAALKDYRRRHKLRSEAQPMPDLVIQADRCEAPFWLDDLIAGSRQRAIIHKTKDGWALVAGDDFALDSSADGWRAAGRLRDFLNARKLRLTPRALTLTLFFRLLLADQFIHGIGGARYDQITDALMAEHFGIEPPSFSVTTATLFFPAAAGKKRVDLSRLAHEGHQLQHRLLGERKIELAEEISDLPRLSSQRRAAFEQMHRLLADARNSDPAWAAWQANFQTAKKQSADEVHLFDRELFFAIQPAERLLAMVRQFEAAFAQVG